MKARESGTPDEGTWEGFFQPRNVLHRLALTESCQGVVDLGCGYGTFTLPAARIASGLVHALDIDAEMVAATAHRAKQAGLEKIRVEQRNFVDKGTGLPDDSVAYVMLFNLLHCAEPVALLSEAHRVLSPGGLLGVMHWNPDLTTPRGPSMAIRPRPAQCRSWAEQTGFRLYSPERVNMPPYHYGLVLKKRE